MDLTTLKSVNQSIYTKTMSSKPPANHGKGHSLHSDPHFVKDQMKLLQWPTDDYSQ